MISKRLTSNLRVWVFHEEATSLITHRQIWLNFDELGVFIALLGLANLVQYWITGSARVTRLAPLDRPGLPSIICASEP
jgi:hypothetical protein